MIFNLYQDRDKVPKGRELLLLIEFLESYQLFFSTPVLRNNAIVGDTKRTIYLRNGCN